MIRGAPLCLAALLGLASAPAQATCLDDTTSADARLFEFHVRLSISELRCGATAPDFTQSINRYFARHQTLLDAAEARLRAAMTTQADRRAFENYAAALANRYGADSGSQNFCSVIGEMLTTLGAESASADDLHTFALVLVREPMLETYCEAPRG